MSGDAENTCGYDFDKEILLIKWQSLWHSVTFLELQGEITEAMAEDMRNNLEAFRPEEEENAD